MQDFSEFGRRERAGWADADVVAAYVDKFGPITDAIGEKLAARVGGPGRAVLDLCCGQGALTAMLCETGAEVTGLDFSDEMLTRAKQNAPDAALHQGDAAALPFGPDSFDVVLCNFGMMHLPDQPTALMEIRRVLRPGGMFVMATWAAPDDSPAFATVMGAVRAHADMSLAPAQPDLFAFAKPEGSRAMLDPAGLSVVSHNLLPAHWSLSEPDELFDIFQRATVATAQLLKTQKSEVVETIRDQVARAVKQEFRHGDGYRVPVPVAVVEAMA